jgi:hypothetical protein
MAIGSLSLTQDHQNVEYHLVTLFEKLDAVRRDATCLSPSTSTPARPSMQVEVRTLEFWRSIISECLAAFFYVFIVCGAASGAGGAPSSLLSTPTPSVTLATALATGFAIATLTQCFGHVSGKKIHMQWLFSRSMLAAAISYAWVHLCIRATCCVGNWLHRVEPLFRSW